MVALSTLQLKPRRAESRIKDAKREGEPITKKNGSARVETGCLEAQSQQERVVVHRRRDYWGLRSHLSCDVSIHSLLR